VNIVNGVCRLFFGKTKAMARALGHDAATEVALNTHLISAHMKGAIGLLFTPREPAEIISYFDNFRPQEYARAGNIATRPFTIPAGTVYSRAGEIPIEEDLPLSHTIEPNLRLLGVPTRLVKGKVELENDYEVCKEGQVLGSAQTTLLKMFGVATAEFHVKLKAYWTKETGEVVVLQGSDTSGGGDMDVDEDEDEDDD
jgi:mRNA turnover protein 4